MLPLLEKLPALVKQLPDTIKKVPHLGRIIHLIGEIAQKVFGYSSGIYIWVSPHTYLFSAVQIPFAGYYLQRSYINVKRHLQDDLKKLAHLSTAIGCLGVFCNHVLRFSQGFSLIVGGARYAFAFETLSFSGRLTANAVELHMASKPDKVIYTKLEITAILLDLVSKGIFALTPYTIPGTVVLVISGLVSFSNVLEVSGLVSLSKYLYTPPSNS